MSLNQSRAERSESSQYRRPGRSGSFSQRNFSGSSGKGGGAAPPPSSSLQSNRSVKKSNTAQGGQPRVGGVNVNPDSNSASAARIVQNGSHLQSTAIPGASNAPVSSAVVKPTTDMSAQKSAQVVPKAPASQPANVKSDSTVPSTPTKAPVDASKSFPIQFGSMSPGTLNGMQIPARTSSAPPNLDEQQRDQARHDSMRQVPAFPIPSVPKQQALRKDGGAGDQSKTGEAQQIAKSRRDVQVSTVAPVSQTQKASVHTLSGVSMQMPFHQSQVPVQFGGPTPQIQSQGLTGTSLPMPIPLPIGSAPQIQQSVYVSSLQHHPMQAPGIMHQGQSLNFTNQMGPQLPPQLSNLGIGVGPQFTQHQAGKFVGSRKPVKITNPVTHEELRLDKRADMYKDGGLSGSRSYQNVPQSQPVTSVPPAHPVNYYSNSLYFPPPGSVPLANAQINPTSQTARFGYPVNQGPQTATFVNPSHNSHSSMNPAHMHGISESSNLDSSRDIHKAVPSVSSASVQVTIKPATGSHLEKINDLAISSSSVEEGESQQRGEASSAHLQRDPEACPDSSLHQPKQSVEPSSFSSALAGKQSPAVSPSNVSIKSNSVGSIPPALLEDSAPVVTLSTESKRETITRSDSIKGQAKKQIKKGHPQPLHQVAGRSTSVSTSPPQSLELTNSFNGPSETLATKPTVSSSSGTNIVEPTREPSLTNSGAASNVSEFRTDDGGPGSLGSKCQSSKTSDGSLIVDSLVTDPCGEHSSFSPHDQLLRLDNLGTKEKGGIVVNEGAIQDENISPTLSDSACSKSPELVLTEAESSVKERTLSLEVRSLKIAEKDLKPVDNSEEDDVMASNRVISSSVAPDTTNADTSSSTLSLLTSSEGDSNSFTSEASVSRSDSLDSRPAAIAKSVVSDDGVALASSILSPEPTLKCKEDAEDVNTGLVYLPAASSKEKLVPELSRSKSIPRGKKKIRDILQRADAAGATSDLYMAYKGPEEKKEIVATSENSGNAPTISLKEDIVDVAQDDSHTGEKGGQGKAEPDDWEDAADISTPMLETADNKDQVSGGLKRDDDDEIGLMEKKYSRDFLLKFSEQCTDLPDGFPNSFEIASDIDALMVPNSNASRDSYPSPGRIVDRSPGGSRRGIAVGDEEKWIKVPVPLVSGRDPRTDGYGGNFRPGLGGNYGGSRNPRVHTPSTPAQYAGGILPGPMQSLGSQGAIQRSNSDSDRWPRATSFQKGLIPSPQTPVPVMHKAEKKYQVGKATDEEEAKQRQLKGILNKLTPQNFEKLFEQVKAVNIDNAGTLTGVISQIFDKALMEPTFCEMYANFCYHLAGELRDFIEDNEKITFKRLLLNKCQEEFERGEREQEEADRADVEGEVKQSDEEREQKRIRARRRMLGNIRLIGELYKKKMLTERIMHECINKLLGQYQNPDEENIEALCKLMSTIGEMIDHHRAKDFMDAYFDALAKLSNNMKLSSRVRFMLKDAIDLRKNKWQQRRKIEGPKKIEEVHRDAAQERQVQGGRLARGPGINPSARTRQPMDFGSRGATMLSSPNIQMSSYRVLPTQLRGYGVQDARMDDRHSFESRTLSVPLPQRPIGDESITLGPQGGLAKGMSIRGQPSMPSIPLAEAPPSPGDSRRVAIGSNGLSPVSDRPVYGLREDLMPRYTAERFTGPCDQAGLPDRNMSYGNRDLRNADRSGHRSRPSSPNVGSGGLTLTQNVSSEKVCPEERLREMSLSTIKEFYSAKDEKEVALCVKDLNSPSFYPTMISIWVNDSFERKDMERDLLAKLLTNLSRSGDAILNHDHLIKGFESVLSTLEDAVNDAPKAGEFLGRIFSKIVMENVIPFSEIGQLIYEGGQERGSLVGIGLAAEVVGTILEIVKSEKGDSFLNDIRNSSSLKLERFRPPHSKRSLRIDKFI